MWTWTFSCIFSKNEKVLCANKNDDFRWHFMQYLIGFLYYFCYVFIGKLIFWFWFNLVHLDCSLEICWNFSILRKFYKMSPFSSKTWKPTEDKEFGSLYTNHLYSNAYLRWGNDLYFKFTLLSWLWTTIWTKLLSRKTNFP